jgi:hypothetical protein
MQNQGKCISLIAMKRRIVMSNNDKGSWIIGGTTMIGIGVGFIFLKTSVFFFVASIMIGIGVGLVIASLNSRK